MYILLSIMMIFIKGCKEENNNEDVKNKKGEKILMIIAPINFRDEELKIPYEIFNKSGFSVDIASKEKKECLGMKVTPDLSIKDVNINNYKAIVFVGGSGAEVYFDDTTVISIVTKAYENKKIIGAICLAPVILANAGILKDKEATVWNGTKDFIIKKEVEYKKDQVIISGNIITAPGPHKAKEFGKKIVRILKN